MWPINWPLVATTNYDPPARTGHQATFKKDRHRFPQDCHIAASLVPSRTAFQHDAMAVAGEERVSTRVHEPKSRGLSPV